MAAKSSVQFLQSSWDLTEAFICQGALY